MTGGTKCRVSSAGLVARSFQGQRAIRVVVRTAHIACAGIVLGAVTFGVAPGPWLAGALVTGSVLIADELYRYGLHWFRFVQSAVILTKLALLWLAAGLVDRWPEAVWAALILGGLISHAPGALRQRALWGGDGPCALPKQAADGIEASA